MALRIPNSQYCLKLNSPVNIPRLYKEVDIISKCAKYNAFYFFIDIIINYIISDLKDFSVLKILFEISRLHI